jgi:hypothetical protein
VLEPNSSDPVATIGKMAHIVAHSNSGPRADASFPNSERDRYENLILLCGTHHDTVDGQPNSYSIADLKQWKSEHGEWVRRSLSEAITRVSFVELEMVTTVLLRTPGIPDESFQVTPPRQKMIRNALTHDYLLAMGLANATVVERFVTSFAATAPDFPEALKAGFLAEYHRLRNQGMQGDDLFEGLRVFSTSGSHDFLRQAAGLCVLAYLFEKCEVFER